VITSRQPNFRIQPTARKRAAADTTRWADKGCAQSVLPRADEVIR
jgi:hypothetical protein